MEIGQRHQSQVGQQMSAGSRVLIVSDRSINSIVPMTYWYEYEDVVAAIDRVDIIAVQPAKHSLETFVGDLALRMKRWTRHRFTPIQPVTLERDYDLLFVINPNLHGRLEALEFVRGWEDRCKVKILYSHEMYVKEFERYRKSVHRRWRRFDHIIAGFPGSTDAATELFGKRCSCHPGAVDAFKFCPIDPFADRPIDVANIGRCSARVHRALLDWTVRTGRWYEYDSTNSCNVLDYSAHRSLLAERLKRTKYFVANPAQFNNRALRGDQEEIGMRHYEGAASGAVIIGQPPECEARRLFFDWEDAIVPIPSDSTAIVDLIEELEASPERTARIRVANVRQTLLRHDWSYRWRQVLELANLEPTEVHVQRETELAKRAASLAPDNAVGCDS